ncbi:MAG TPA: hypothetical protein PKV16_00420 [Caldisericia bacterium]|nr:hypothetical protein [Caldisericia bacterium]HPQ92241.1 hypothetical protein [Caldisericia bacterium]
MVKKFALSTVVLCLVSVMTACNQMKTNTESGDLTGIEGRFKPNIETQDTEPVSVDENIQFYWKDKVICKAKVEKIENFSRVYMQGIDETEGSSAKAFYKTKKADLKLAEEFEYYYRGSISGWEILTVPVDGPMWAIKIDGKTRPISMSRLYVTRTYLSKHLISIDTGLLVPFEPMQIDNTEGSSGKCIESPIKAVDIDGDGELEIACYSTTLSGRASLKWQFVKNRLHIQNLSVDLVSFDVDIGDIITDTQSGRTVFSSIFGMLQTKQDSNMPHILELDSNNQLIEVSYKYPGTLKNLIEQNDNLDMNHPLTNLLFTEQIGELWSSRNAVPTAVNEYINWSGADSCDKEQIDWLKEHSSKNSDFYSKMSFQKTEDDYYLDNRTEQEIYEDELDGFHHNTYIEHNRHKLWNAFEWKYIENGYVSSDELKEICYSEIPETNHHRWYHEGELPEEPDTPINVEPNSYWPERQLGRFEIVESDFTPKSVGSSQFESFPRTVLSYIFATFTQRYYGGIGMPEKPIDYSEVEFDIAPLTEDVWIVNCHFMRSEYSIIRIDRNNLVEQLLDWQSPGVLGSFTIDGLCDINRDGVMDAVISWNGMGATHIASNKIIWTYKDDKLKQIAFDIDGLDYSSNMEKSIYGQVEYFYGLVDRCPTFGTYELGVNAFEWSLYTCEAAMRYSCLRIMQVREDGHIYDVTFKYPSYEHIENLRELADDEHKDMWFRNLVHLESIGLTNKAQKKYLECNSEEGYDYQIVKDCQKIGKPFVVQTPEECPAGWDIHHVYR